MNIIAIRTLREFWEDHPQAEKPLRTLYSRLIAEDWSGPADIKKAFGPTVDFVAGNRGVFDVSGNKYRVVIAFAYPFKRGFVKFVGTHAQYDRIDVRTI